MKSIRSLSFLSFILLPGAFLLSCSKGPSECSYSTDASSVKIEWTAYKTSKKVGVKGSFDGAKVSGPTSAKSLADLMKGLQMEIDGATVNSGNPGRDATLKEFFFQKIPGGATIKASVDKVEGDESKGSLQIKIDMNGASQTLPFAYTAQADGTFQAGASFDMAQFNLQPALDSIHQACQDKHAGDDGVSKTWSEVGLNLTGKFKKDCH